MVAEASEFGSRIACLSTPSVYFSLPPSVRANARVFDIDTAFATDSGFVEWSFKSDPNSIPAQYANAFDYVIIDPPFISEAVWAKYAAHAKHLLVKGDELDAAGDALIDNARGPVRVSTPYGTGVLRSPPQQNGARALTPDANGFFTVELSWGATATLTADSVSIAKVCTSDGMRLHTGGWVRVY